MIGDSPGQSNRPARVSVSADRLALVRLRKNGAARKLPMTRDDESQKKQEKPCVTKPHLRAAAGIAWATAKSVGRR